MLLFPQQLKTNKIGTQMEILHILSTFNGGAGAASYKIIRCLQKSSKFNHRVIFKHGQQKIENALKISTSKRLPAAQINRLMFSLAKKGRAKGFEAYTPTNVFVNSKDIKPLIDASNIIHLHWLGDWHFDLKQIFDFIPKDMPVIITMHDMHFITAGCHYSSGCNAHHSACEKCPQIPGLFGRFLSKKSHYEKLTAYSNHKIILVPASSWLESETHASSLGKIANKIYKIGYPIPLVKEAIDPIVAAKRLELMPTLKKKVLLVAQDLSNPRKGSSLLLQALEKNLLPNCTVITVGEQVAMSHPDLFQLGFIKDKELMRCAYAYSDVLCLPSLEENLAQTGLESLSEGTPVVCFKNTGPSDYVHDLKTGMNCPSKTYSDLAKTILACLKNKKLMNKAMVRSAYKAQHEMAYHEQVVVNQYENLYESSTL